MADPFSNPNNRFVVQPAETSADTLQLTARTATNVITDASAAANFHSAGKATKIIAVAINGTTYYVPASTTTW